MKMPQLQNGRKGDSSSEIPAFYVHGNKEWNYHPCDLSRRIHEGCVTLWNQGWIIHQFLPALRWTLARQVHSIQTRPSTTRAGRCEPWVHVITLPLLLADTYIYIYIGQSSRDQSCWSTWRWVVICYGQYYHHDYTNQNAAIASCDLPSSNHWRRDSAELFEMFSSRYVASEWVYLDVPYIHV